MTYQQSKHLERSLLTIFLAIIYCLLSPDKTLASEENVIKEVKYYINNIKSVAIEFTQTDSQGKTARGMLLIQKPYNFRFNYYEPFPLLICGNKNYVSIYDYDMETITRISPEENVLNFLLLNNVNLEKKIEIISAHEDQTQYSITARTKDLDKIVELWFDKANRSLSKMQIFEDDNTITINFLKTHILHSVPDKLFTLKDPDRYGAPTRINKEQLLKMIK